MKKLYFVLLLCFAVASYGQEGAPNPIAPKKTQANFKLYPNPAYNNVVYITTQKNKVKDITVYDVFGEVVLRDRIKNNSLDISRLVPGVYVLQVTENEHTMNRKLVVK